MKLGIQSKGQSLHGLSAEDFFEGIDQLQTGFAVYDEDMNFIFANKALRRYFPILYTNLDSSLPLIESIAAQIADIQPELSPQQLMERAAAIFDTIKASGKMEALTSEGRRISSVYEKTKSGYYLIVSIDVTERVQHKRELTKARRDADTANQAKSDFLATMSHEIRTPLSGVYGAAQILQKRIHASDNTDLIELADILTSSTNDLMVLINDVLDLSKIEAGQTDINPSEENLRDLLGTLQKSVQHLTAEKNLELRLVIDRSVPDRLILDPARIRQCVSNLVTNAIKFTAQGSITIAALYDGVSQVTIHVVDTGIGIAPEHREHLFERFAQAKADTTKIYGGTGLGLAISRKLARLMGGDITIASQAEKGSAFTLTFASEPAVNLATKAA